QSRAYSSCASAGMRLRATNPPPLVEVSFVATRGMCSALCSRRCVFRKSVQEDAPKPCESWCLVRSRVVPGTRTDNGLGQGEGHNVTLKLKSYFRSFPPPTETRVIRDTE